MIKLCLRELVLDVPLYLALDAHYKEAGFRHSDTLLAKLAGAVNLLVSLGWYLLRLPLSGINADDPVLRNATFRLSRDLLGLLSRRSALDLQTHISLG